MLYEIRTPIRPNVITAVRKLNQYSQGHKLKHSLLHAQFTLKSAPTITTTPISQPFSFTVVNYVLLMYHAQPVNANYHFLNAVYVVADGSTLPQYMQHSGMFEFICIFPSFAFKFSAKAQFHTHTFSQ